MPTLVSNCAGDENGCAYGGAAGDQTTYEYRVRPWYDFEYTAVYRHPNARVRALIAQLATEAANNDRIGYDQSQRLTFRNQLRACGFRPGNITAKCETDCSASTGAIIEAVGQLLGDKRLADFDTTLSTHYMDGPLVAAGFTKLTATKYLASGEHLIAGDICLRPAKHVNIVVSGSSEDTDEEEVLVVQKQLRFRRKTNVREKPSTKAAIVTAYDKGKTVIIEGLTFGEGKVWCYYTGATSGKRRYFSVGAQNVEAL